MITLVNFSDKDFRSKQRWNSISGKLFGGIDKVLSYGINDIDKSFLESNKDILKYSKGFGNYFWKPYIIKKALKEIKEGDFLFYADSGSIFLKSIKSLTIHLEGKKKSILCFKLPLIEKQWTKRDAFIRMDCDTPVFTDTAQILATFILIKKNNESEVFINNYFEFSKDHRILSDNPNVMGFQNYPEFIEHRHDQSILSLLCKKNNNVLIEGDLSDYGFFTNKYLFEETYLFDKKMMDPNNHFFKGILLSNRTVHPLFYLFKYLTKLSLYRLGIKI
jgi:hypothetical protein